MICQRCKKEIPDDAKLCCYCGRVYERKAPRQRKANGEGCVIQRGDTWTIRITTGWVERPGRRPLQLIKTKGGFHTRAEAVAYVPILKAQTKKAMIAPMLEAYWNSYAKNELEKLSDSKRTAYTIAWRKLSRLHRIQVDQITVQMLRETVTAAASTYYPAHDCKQLLKNLFKLAAAERWVDKDLPDFIILPELVEKERTAFTPEEQQALWKIYETGNLDAAIPLVMIYTGMMPGELRQLRPEMINWETHEITGVGMKTKVRKKSAVYFPDALEPVLRDLAAASTSDAGYILPRNETAFYDRYYAALAAAGCRRLEPYSCRHTTATALAVDANIAPQTVRKIMRWSTTKMLDRYAHPDQADALAGVQAIAPQK
jgi:integrase